MATIQGEEKLNSNLLNPAQKIVTSYSRGEAGKINKITYTSMYLKEYTTIYIYIYIYEPILKYIFILSLDQQ